MWRSKASFFTALAIVVFLAIIPLLWFKPGFIAAGHDMGYSFTPMSRVASRIFVWSDAMNIGEDSSSNIGSIVTYLPEAILQALGFSLRTGQILVFIFWFILPGLSMFFLLKTISDYDNFIGKFKIYFLVVGSLFYSLNHYLLQGWFAALRQEFSLVIVTPLIISFLFRVFTRKKNFFRLGVIGALLLTFFNGTGGMGVPIFAGLGLVIFWFLFYFGFISWRNKKNRENFLQCLKFIGVLILFFVIFNAYWIFPLLYYVKNHYFYEVGLAGGVPGVSGWVEVVTKYANFNNLLRLQGFSGWYDIRNHPYSNTFLENPFFIILSFIWPLMILLSLQIHSKKYEKEKYFVGFFFGLVLLGIFFMSGSRSSLGFIYNLLLNIPGFVAIRTPFYKFGYVLWIAYAVLISYSFVFIVKKISETTIIKDCFKGIIKKSSLVIFIAIIAIYNYPFFIGIFFNWNSPFSTMIKPPPYVFAFQDWVNKEAGNNRILIYPKLLSEDADQYTWNYWSLTPFANLLTEKSIISNSNNFTENQKKLLNEFYNAINRKDKDVTLKLADILNVEYILFRRDIKISNVALSLPVSNFQNILNSSPWFVPAKEFGDWVVYKIIKEKDSQLSDIELKQSVTYVNEARSMGKFIDLINDDSLILEDSFETDKIKIPVFLHVVAAGCNFCNLDTIPTDFSFSQTAVPPTSPFYNLLRLKEETELKFADSNRKRITLLTDYASRRLNELSYLSDFLSKTKNNYLQTIYGKKRDELFIELQMLLDKIYDIRATDIKTEPLNYPYNRDMEGFVVSMKRGLNNLKRGIPNDESLDIIFTSLNEKLNKLQVLTEEKFWRTTSEDTLKFILNISKKDSYTVYLKPDDNLIYDDIFEESFLKSQLELDSNVKKQTDSLINNIGYKFGETILSYGSHKVLLKIPKYKNLLSFQPNLVVQPYGNPLSLVVPSIMPNQKYMLSFDYKTDSTRDIQVAVRVLLSEGKTQKIIAKSLNESKETHQRILIETPDVAKSIIVTFSYSDLSNDSVPIQVENLNMHLLINPTLLILSNKKDLSLNPMLMNYEKYNQTFYTLNVSNNSKPFFILLKQKYSDAWKLYRIPENNIFNDCRNIICDAFRQIYIIFNGKELEANHSIADGYANTWYIAPDDIGSNKLSFAIIYSSQIIAWFGFFITFLSILTTLLVMTCLFLMRFLRK